MKKGTVKHATQGGQILLHDLHMIGQVLQKVIFWLLPIGILITIGWFTLMTTSYQRYIGSQWLWAKAFVEVDGVQHQQPFQYSDSHSIRVHSVEILNAPRIKKEIMHLKSKLVQSSALGLGGYIFSIVGVVTWLRKRGTRQITQKTIGGDYLATVEEVKELMHQKNQLSDIVLGQEKLPLPRHCEMQHLLFHGTTGSGKSTGIKELLDHIRRRGERAIIYDKGCHLVEQFYQLEKDYLLNPLDQRSVVWNLWQECRDRADFDNLAAALIPMPPNTQDPFWVNAARTIFASAAYQMQLKSSEIKPPHVTKLLALLLTSDLRGLQELLKGTEAETLISDKAEKTAISVKAVLATYLKSLSYIQQGVNPFSIRHWVQDNNAANWLFMSSLGDKHESLKPLMTAWLDIAINALLSLSVNTDRRIWVILDELTSLQQLPYLTAALSEARKFGGCFAIGIQSYAQLAKVYGQEGAKEISSLINTRFMFRVPDPEIAQWACKNLGQTTLEEAREGISYGANSIRDGVSINYVERDKPVANYSDILRLNDLCCYARLPGGYPITKINFQYFHRKVQNAAFELHACL